MKISIAGNRRSSKVKSFLSEMVAKQPSFSIAGKIRAGMKLPTKQTLASPEAMRIVNRTKNGEISYQQAATEIQKRCGIDKPFYPRNTPFYSAHPWDLESGQVAADKLLSLYGEMREGDTKPRLYRFPVVFPDIHKGGIDLALGSGLAVRGGGPRTIHYQSRYGDDGVRRCVYLPPVVKTQDTSRKQHPRRDFVVRGLCEPDICPQYAANECRFAGTLRFYIPGMPGAGLFSLETSSTLAASEIYLRLSSLLQECGTLPNFTPDGRPVFWLTKAQKQRNYFDNEANPQRGLQWVPILETEIDLTKVRMLQEQKRALIAAPSAAPVSAGVPAAWAMQAPEDEEEDHGGSFAPVDEDGVIGDGAAPFLEGYEPPAQEVIAPQKHDALTDLFAKAEGMGIVEKVREWGALRFGDDWQTEKATAALESLAAIESRFGTHAGIFLDLQIRLISHGISFQEVAMPYFKAKFGGIGMGANLVSIVAHVDELLEQGPSVARSHMEANC